MDERHWWIAGKIQESFHIDGLDNPQILEDFICEPGTLSMINQFFHPNGPCRLFFYCDKPESTHHSLRELHATESLATLKNLDINDVIILYFLRHRTDIEVDPSHMEKDIFCGELKGNTLETLSSVLSEIYVPLIKSQKDWGKTIGENQMVFMHNLDKVVSSLSETSGSSHSTKHVMLKLPENVVGTDFKQHRLAASDQTIITEYEDLVMDWISTIEAILTDTSDERFMDPNAGPLSELERWKRRQRLLVSITEQLKGKECKAVIGVLITAKSRLLKKWKLIDSGITDAMNETKDKVRYLESLKRHLDQLYGPAASPSTIINSALPGLLHSVKQMDSVSRFYARQGFLGLLFTKVTNQLVLACKEYVQQCTLTIDDEDLLWEKVGEEIEQRDSNFSDPHQKHFHAQLESRLKAPHLNKKKGDNQKSETLYARLRACLSLQAYYRDSIRSLRDALGASQNLSHFTSLSSLHAGSITARSFISKNKPKSTPHRVSVSTSPSKKTASISDPGDGHGVSVADEETIMSHMDSFCGRIKQILDVVNTLAQFSKMLKTTGGLPRPRKEDLIYEETKAEKEARLAAEHRDASSPETKASIPVTEDNDLEVIAEDEEELYNRAAKKKEEENQGDVVNVHSGLTLKDVELLKRYYPDNPRDEGPSVTTVVEEHVVSMTMTMRESVTTKTMLDVESKDRDRFEEIYANFLHISHALEHFFCAYLNAIFSRKMRTHEALDMMTKFVPIQQRSGVRVVIAEKFVEIFNWYEGDLDEIQQIYEKYKEEPPVLRNAPPVAGAISWSRQLLKRIEDPMKVFRDNRAITNLKDFGRIVKIYNRLATALVTFESLWFSHWRQSIEFARNGLKATLFILHPHTGEIMVNADEKVTELIHEAKCLTRLGIVIPEAAQTVLQQEARFKNYKDHLNLCLRDFRAVCDSIPDVLSELFKSHVDKCLESFQPGLNTLAWNSMNIDAFLHQIHTSTANLQYLVERVNDIITHQVEGTIDSIKDMVFFDYKLAFSKSWPPDEFSTVIGDSIKQQSRVLYDYITTIETGIKECANILTSKRKTGTGGRDKGSSHDIAKSKAPREEEAIVSGLQILKFLHSYGNPIYHAVLMATTRSLVTLAEASGCEGQIIRAASAMSDAPSSHTGIRTPGGIDVGIRSGAASRAMSAVSERSQPVSILSMLSNMTWTTDKTEEITYLKGREFFRFEVQVKFSIPNIVIEPALTSIQTALNLLARTVLQVPRGVRWLGTDNLGEQFSYRIEEDDAINDILSQLDRVVGELEQVVKTHILHFSCYDFLWKDDLHGNYFEFIEHDPGMHAISREVERLLKIEKKVCAIPEVLPVGPICLQTDPIKDALHGFSMAWKHQYASVLHDEAKRKLDAAVLYRHNVRQRLELNVVSLDQLNSTTALLEELRDMENKIDEIYLPIENMYAKLREFELRLPRNEVEEVDSLRDSWQELLTLADQVRLVLLKEKRSAFEQELDKQVKGFVVEVIQFRNAFDAQGPAVPGIVPGEAVTRLQDFQMRYSLYDAKRKTLDNVSKLFGIPCKPFPELDKTGEELELLGMLYGLFQKFLRFDRRFRDTLWSEADLEAATREVESYWDECLALPSKLKDWDAYNDMKGSIQLYRDVFPLLHNLASKEIRNRHWLQVMAVTGSSFQLEANVFKLSDLLDIDLIKHRVEIEEICRSASRELELEVKLRMTEEEWTEQVLNFEVYKKRGPMFLDKSFTERLLEQLEDAQALLAQMLTSRYIGPLREEAASWAEKLKEVSEVLETWLEVQDLWNYLEAVFSNDNTAKELPQEAKRFARIDKSWTKMMKRTYDTRNVLQCCYGEEVPKGVVLRHIYQELEICFKSLTGYLDNKRRSFPRFYFVSDPVLLAILSHPNDLDSVKPYLRSLFGGIHDVRLEKARISDSENELGDIIGKDGTRRSSLSGDRSRGPSVMSPHMNNATPPKIDKRLTQIHEKQKKEKGTKGQLRKGVLRSDRLGQKALRGGFGAKSLNTNLQMHVSSVLPSEMMLEETVTMEAHTVLSAEGEFLKLDERVSLVDGVECWLSNLKESVHSTMYDMVLQITIDIGNGASCDEWAIKYPTQVCRLGMLYFWTKECEAGVSELKYDRKALNTTGKRFSTAVARLPASITKGSWRNTDEQMAPVHKVRLENMISQSLFLRDMIDNMSQRKLRENTDFEWRRNLRFYVHEEDDKPTPLLYMLEEKYNYGCEFLGAQPVVGLTPVTDKCYLSMSQAIKACRGSMVTGESASGKTETVKGFSQSLGYFLMMFQCSPGTDTGALGKAVQGLAMDGSWGCFDDIQRLNKDGLAVLIDHIQAILGALQAKTDYCFIADGQEIPVKPTAGIFTTMNTSVTMTTPLPNELKKLFRQVALLRPDTDLVLKAKCSSLGIKSPAVLATRLKLVAELARDQLPEESHHNLSIASLVGVLHRATSRRKFKQEAEKSTLDRPDKRTLSDLNDTTNSRSNSQMSTAPSNFPLQNQSSTLIGGSVSAQKTAGARKSGTPNPLTTGAKQEHSLVSQALQDIITPRLAPENQAIFRQIVKDVFAGLPDIPKGSKMAMSAHSRSYDIEAALESTAGENGLVNHKPWMEKCLQLYNVSSVHQGIIVVGPPGSGKSTIVECLVDALCVTPRGLSRGSNRTRPTDISETNHKLQRLHPLVADDLSLIFGHLNQNHDWVDGIFTSAWKKASRNQSTTWLALDGPLNASWVDQFTSVLDGSKTLNLTNGDQLFLSNNVKLLFETDEINDASPAMVARTGIVYVDKNVVGWQPIAKAWLENRTQQEVRVLQRAFNKTLDAVSHFVMNECRPKLRLSEVGMFQTCINMLSAMLSDNVEIGGELHIERLYLFCLMWSFGGLLEEKDKKGFNDLLGTLSTALPDDDSHVCFFDYYVDESGEWDPWQSRVPETAFNDSHNLLGEVFVDTVDSIRTRLLMDFAYASGQNVLLVGPPGSGKTAMINDFIDTQDPQAQITKKLVYSGSSNAHQLQSFIEANIYHRQGFVYGAKESKRLQLFIDDLNLPNPDEHGVQRCNELLRRMLDDRVLCTLQKPFEWRTIEGLSVLSAMTMCEYPSVPNRPLSPRLLRHFAVFSLPGPTEDSLKAIVNTVLEGNMQAGDHTGLDIELHNGIVQASVRMLAMVKNVLRPSPTPGRKHYFFTLKDIVTCFQCIKRLADESRADETMVVSLWRHEVERIIKDRICRFSDLSWFNTTMDDTINEIWPDLAESLHKYFVTFPVDARVYQRPVTSISKKEVRVVLQPVESLKEVHNCLQTHLNRYNEEFGNEYLDIMLSENIIHHVIKMHRVLSYHHGGNFLLVGPIGSHLGTLCKLALHVADLEIHHIDSSKQNTFFDGLRSAVRLTGAEGKTRVLFFTGRDLEDPQYLDAINCLLVSGEYPHLFTNDEMEGLLLALGPSMKREHPSINMDLMKFFVSRVKTNLKILICLHPRHNLLNIASSQYPGLLSGCQLIWMSDWTKDSLIGEASYYLNKHSLTKDCEGDLAENIVTCMANIHSFVLHDCKQTMWAGDESEEITVTQVKIHEKKKDQLKVQSMKLPNRPYSKTIMLENIKLRHRRVGLGSTNELFVGPTTYRRFMDIFRAIYTQKAEKRTDKDGKLKKVIATLDQTRKDARKMRESIKNVSKKYDEARVRTAELLQELTSRATVLEKLKAKVGQSTSLSAFLQLNELSDDEHEDDDLLAEEARDEYDDEFDKMREANLKTRSVQAKEDHSTALKRVDDCRKKLAHAREQVLFWRKKVDRSCIERVRNFQNPPMLVGHVMEMIMTLIGKKSVNMGREKGDYPAHDGQSGRYSASSSSTKLTNKKTKPAKDSNERFDRASWKNMQVTMNDSLKFVDMLHNVTWEDGLPGDVVGAVESYLTKSRDGQLGVTGEGSLLDNAQEKDKSFVAVRRSPSPENQKGITIAAAKYSSEDAAVLVQYAIALVEYTRHCGPLKAALEKVQDLQREIEENARIQKEKEKQRLKEEGEDGEHHDENGPSEEETSKTPPPEEELDEDDLPKVQAEVDNLQAQFDLAVVEKHSLELELTSMRERLKAATGMIDSLKQQETSWRHHVKEFGNNDVLVSNCITAAAFIAYCGGMNVDTRKRMADFFNTICEHHGLPLPTKKLFKDMELVSFFYDQLYIKEMESLRLPTTRLMLENATFLMQGDNTMAWPLLCDPTCRVVDWIRDYNTQKGLVVVRYSEIRSQFDTCLAEGLPLLITDIDVTNFIRDPRFVKVVLSRNKFVPGRAPFKIPVGDHDVECQPHFRMYLHTTQPAYSVPPELAAYVSVIFFHQSRIDIEEELLNRFMMLEKSRVDEERKALLQERLENMRHLSTLEDEMVECLSSDVRLLNDLLNTKKLAEFKKHYDETEETLSRIDSSESSIMRNREGFRVIAKRAAVMFDTSQYMREVSHLYQITFKQYLALYDAAISHSDRAAIKSVVDRLTYAAFVSTIRCLSDKDKPLYQLLQALEIEDAEGRVGLGEREYLISPSLGSVTMTALGIALSADSRFAQAKKPFDWMTDEQFNNLQILALHYEWFQEMFDRMPKDGRETQWRTLCESDQPEMQQLPDKMDEHYTPLQRMLVIRAVRSDRLMQMSTLYINAVMGKKYSGEIAIDLPMLLRQSSPTVPVLVLYCMESESAEKLITEFAVKKQCKLRVVALSGNGQGEEKIAKKFINKGMKEGTWVMLQNAHNAMGLLKNLEVILGESEQKDSQFRLFVTAQASDKFPTRMLQMCVRVMVDTARTMKESLVRSFSWLDADTLKQTSRPEWLPIIHNLCFVHSSIRLRARFGRGGWNIPSDILQIGNSEFFEAIKMLSAEMQDNLTTLNPDGNPIPRTVSWTGIRFMLAEMIYGNYITDPLDQLSLCAMVDYWISPNAVKKDFELAKLKYRTPSVFFSSHPRFAQLTQALENINNHFLETPEACNMHPSTETILGDDQYVFTRLNKIFDTMPATPSLTHQLFPRAPTPFDAARFGSACKSRPVTTTMSVISPLPTPRMPSMSKLSRRFTKRRNTGFSGGFGLGGPPLSTVSTSANNPLVAGKGVFASASFAALKMRKEVELWEICHTMLPRVPRSYSKEYITERVKKIGGFTSFNLYMMKELELMYRLISEIKSTLQAIKNACEVSNLGDHLTPVQLEAADDLYHLRLPGSWCRLAGNTAPPGNQAIGTWLTDLQNRAQHFERILVLGREKMPAYWLGAFFYPRGLLSMLKQDCYRNHANDRSGNIDTYVFQTEVTARDKDHIRDPPAEGMFVFGIYLWGCAWEKTTGELIDAPPKQQCASLPVIHLTCWPQGEKPVLQDPTRASEVYPCPVYHSNIASRAPIMELDLYHAGIQSSRWALRGLSATIRPY